MKSIQCLNITSETKQIAEKLHLNDKLTVNIISAYMSLNNTQELPTLEELNIYLNRNKGLYKEALFAVPTHKYLRQDTIKSLVETKDNIVYLTNLNILDDFFNNLPEQYSIENKEKLHSQIKSKEDAYRFLLWSELSKQINPEVSFEESFNDSMYKLIEYNKLNPIKNIERIQTQKPLQQSDNTISYTPQGKTKQIYTITGNKIYNKEGKEVFKEDSVDRNKIFANYAVKQNKAVIVNYKNKNYIINSKNAIMSGTSGKIMKWEDKNADRKNILNLANEKFERNKLKNNQTQTQSQEIISPVTTDILDTKLDNSRVKYEKDINVHKYERAVQLAGDFKQILNYYVKQLIEDKTKELGSLDMKKDAALYGELFTQIYNLQDPETSRATLLSLVPIEVMFNDLKNQYQELADTSLEDYIEDYGEEYGKYLKVECEKIIEHFNFILEDALLEIEKIEDIRIEIVEHAYHNGEDHSTVLGATIEPSTTKQATEEDNFGDDDEGKRAEGNTGWAFKVRFVDPHTTLSKSVKRVLGNLIKLDKEGNIVYNDLGGVTYLDERYVYSILMNNLSKMISPDDFILKNNESEDSFPTLEKMLIKYPWIQTIINELKENDSLVSKFYSNFRQDFIPYWLQIKDPKKKIIVSKQLNKTLAVEGMMTIITNNLDSRNILSSKYSLYNNKGGINTDNIQSFEDLKNEIKQQLNRFENGDETSEIINNFTDLLERLGIEVEDSAILTLLNGENISKLKSVITSLEYILDNLKKIKDNVNLAITFKSDFTKIAGILGSVSELNNVDSARQGDTTRYSYSAPNHINTLIKQFTDTNNERRESFIQDKFGKFRWFKKGEKWLNEWVKLLHEDGDIRKNFNSKELIVLENKIGEKVDYENWDDELIKTSYISEFYSIPKSKTKKQYGFYNMSIFADAPVVKFIKMIRYTTDSEGTYKEKLIPLFRNVILQELYRINLVEQRNKKGVAKIKNFDKNGLKFNFFPLLNNTDFLNKCKNLISEKQNTELKNYIDATLKNLLDYNFNIFLTNNVGNSSEITKRLEDSKVLTKDNTYESLMEEYYWNNAFAQIMLIELTTTDLAYYKNFLDFQKRYKEVYAAGKKLNTNSKFGKKTEKSILIQDTILTSSRLDVIKKVLEDKVGIDIESKDVDNILYKFQNINATDAQSFRTLTSMKSVLDMLGEWNPSMEQTLERFKNEEWNMGDFNIIWQTLKPFMYSQIAKNANIGTEDLIKVPVHHKNSEFLLLAMYDLLSSKVKSPQMKVLGEFMDKHNIDVVHYESASKIGTQSIVNIEYNPNKVDINNIENIKAEYDKQLLEGKITQEEYNNTFESFKFTPEELTEYLEDTLYDGGQEKEDYFYNVPYEDYVIQQPNPEHLVDYVAVFGSQFRNLIVSDISDDPNFRININGKEYTKQQVLDLYNSLIVENLLESYDKVASKFNNIETLQKALEQQVKSNPKYGKDMVNAIQLVTITNPITGQQEKVFNIPLYNITTTLKVQELLNSFFKNNITKQNIKGGACTLVSSIGYTKELQIMRDENDNPIGFECYMPAWSKSFFDVILDKETGQLDINKLPKELRKLVGYRIPTEGKYSMLPLYVKGFLPQQNGSAIMLPAEITTLSGADFDIDKLFLMIPSFKTIKKYNLKEAWDDFYKENPEEVNRINEKQNNEFNKILNEYLESNTNSDLDIDAAFESFIKLKQQNEWLYSTKDKFKNWFDNNKDSYYIKTVFEKVKYDASKPTYDGRNIKSARDNMIIDISYSILTNEDVMSKFYNPGNFDGVSRAAKLGNIMKNQNMIRDIQNRFNFTTIAEIRDYLNSLSLDDIIKLNELIISNMDPLSLDTYSYFHKQNTTAAALIGMYANNTNLQAKFQNTPLKIKDDYTYDFNNNHIKDLTRIKDYDGKYISQNCAQFSAASVDDVKDPNLADLGQNIKTAVLTSFLLRSGISIKDIGLIFNQPIIHNTSILTLFKEGSKYNKWLTDVPALNSELLTNTILFNTLHPQVLADLSFDNLNQQEVKKFIVANYYIYKMYTNMIGISIDLNSISKVSRADSPNNALPITVSGAFNKIYQVNALQERMKSDDFSLIGGQDLLKNKVINSLNSKDLMREKLLNSSLPLLQAFYSLGIELSQELLSPYFIQSSKYVQNITTKLLKNSKYNNLPDKVLNKLYSDFIIFGLSNSKIFGNDDIHTLEEKRNYYLLDFPFKLLKLKQSNADVNNLNAIKKLSIYKGKIIMKDANRLSEPMKESLMRDFDSLLYSPNIEDQQLAVDLFMYSYYSNGLQFGSDSFGRFFSTTFITRFPDYIQTLRMMPYDVFRGSKFDNFLSQFYYNNNDLKLVPNIKDAKKGSEEGTIQVSNSEILNNNFSKPTIYQIIKYEYNLYIFDNYDSKNSSIFRIVPTKTRNQIISNESYYNFNSNLNTLSQNTLEYNKKKALLKLTGNDFDETVITPEDTLNKVDGLEDTMITNDYNMDELNSLAGDISEFNSMFGESAESNKSFFDREALEELEQFRKNPQAFKSINNSKYNQDASKLDEFACKK